MPAVHRRPNLTQEQRQAIRDMVERFPKMTYSEVGARLDVQPGTVSNVINQAAGRQYYPKKPVAVAKVITHNPPACTVQQPNSIIRPVPISRLMARR